jgi:hypothetical protein
MGKEGAAELSFGESLLLYLAHWLTVTRAIPADQQDLLVTEFGREVVSYGDSFDAMMSGPEATIPSCVVTVLDRSFAIVSGRDVFLNLHRAEYVKGLPRPPIESISYNLAGLYAQMRASLRPKKGLKSSQEGGIIS